MAAPGPLAGAVRPPAAKAPSRGPLLLLAGAVFALGSACSTPEPPPPPPKLEYVPAPSSADALLPELTEPPTYGQQCTDADQCTNGGKGWCLCTEPLPEGGSEAVGFCWNGRIKRGKWWCTVEDGHAVRMGVIFP